MSRRSRAKCGVRAQGGPVPAPNTTQPFSRLSSFMIAELFTHFISFITDTLLYCSSSSYDDKRMEFALVQIKFPDSNPNPETSSPSSLPPSKSQSPPSPDVPFFHPLKTFKMTGLVMNVFLLDPVARLLSGFVWIVNSSTIGLFVLLDWDKDEFVFVDTRIPCVRPPSPQPKIILTHIPRLPS